MLQEFNESDLSSTAIPEPKLLLLTPLERGLFGGYIVRQYRQVATKFPRKLKRDLFYYGMKFKLRNYEVKRMSIMVSVFIVVSVFEPFLADIFSWHSQIRIIVLVVFLTSYFLFDIFVIFRLGSVQNQARLS
jgi:hypothetical protein